MINNAFEKLTNKMALGGKKKKRGKKAAQSQDKRKLRFPEPNENYAQVKNLLGDRRVEVKVQGKGIRKARIPGRFRKRIWINREDWVLVQSRDCDDRADSTCDITYMYKHEEIRKLERLGEIETENVDNDDDDEEENFETLKEYTGENNDDNNDIDYPSSFTSSEYEDDL